MKLIVKIKDDLYYVTHSNNTTRWFQDPNMTIRHRLNGPAVICSDGTKLWYRLNCLHREDGPAIETKNGHKGYFYNGERFASEKEYTSVMNFIKYNSLPGAFKSGPKMRDSRYPSEDRFPTLKVTASGGISSLDDLRKLKALGLHGAIIGKALYDGTVDLRELKALL